MRLRTWGWNRACSLVISWAARVGSEPATFVSSGSVKEAYRRSTSSSCPIWSHFMWGPTQLTRKYEATFTNQTHQVCSRKTFSLTKKIGKRKWKFPKGGVGGVRPFGKNSQKMSFFWQAPLYVIRYNYVQLAVFFAERNHAMVGRDRCRCNKTCRTPQTCPGPPNDARCANQQDIRSLPGTIVLATDWWMDHTF